MSKEKKSRDKHAEILIPSEVRPLGQTLLDLELILDEMVDTHELQWGDILNLIHGHLEIHSPQAQEEYVSGGSPVFYYGPNKD